MWPCPPFCLTTTTTLYSTYSAISMARAHVLRDSYKKFEKVRVRKQLLGQFRGCAWFTLVVWGWWSIARLYDFVGIPFFGLVILRDSYKKFEKVRVRKQLLGQFRGCAWFTLVVWGWWSIARLYDFVGIPFFGLVILKVHDYFASLLEVLLFSCQ